MLPPFRACIILTAALTAVSCRSARDTAPHIVQPGAPGAASRVISTTEATDLSGVAFTEADVRFMQGMLAHHAQAVEMTTLLASRTQDEAMRMLGERIRQSQEDEMAMMRDWLTRRGQPVPDADAHHGHGTLMPGMLTPEEMARLAAASGPEFDRLFLEGMIKHHEGALTMVEELFGTPGAGQESEIFAFASDVDVDQRMEIARMRAMLKERQR
ncbi:MAG TPA: DUF305 domain-containing protein [Vicinamibacterales bacterium]